MKDSEQTLKLVQALTKVDGLNVGVNRVKKTRNKGVLFELRNQEECANLVNHIQDSNPQLTAIIPKHKNPRLIIHGIEPDFPDADLVKAIIKQNPCVQHCLLEPTQVVEKRVMKRARNGDTQYAVIEVSPTIYHAVKREEKLYIGYKRCSVKDYIPVIRCHNCCGYGHFAADCKTQKMLYLFGGTQ